MMEFAELIKKPIIEKVILQQPHRQSIECTLCTTTHYLIFSSCNNTKDELWLLHSMVDVVERRFNSGSSASSGGGSQLSNYAQQLSTGQSYSQSQSGGQLVLKCKDFRQIILKIVNTDDLINLSNSIESLSNLDDPRLSYPYFFPPNFVPLEDGWKTFDLQSEFNAIKHHSDEWRISNVNKNFAICPSYPEHVIVPKDISDEKLIAISQFRCLGRFPVLSYFHQSNKAALMRSGQPMIGTGSKRCKEDEKLINTALSQGIKGYIIETRTQNLAQMARSKGGGFELEMHYPLWRRVHKPIDRHCFLLESLSKLVDACSDSQCSMEKWQSRVESSGWLSHIKDVLMCACLVAQCIDQEGASVLVHGAEGMDSTLQVCSLAQIILNPAVRTIRGFQWLIEREWINAGHPFQTRCSKSGFAFSSSQTNREHSPIFLVFLDCVYQICNQFPCSFEFNEKFLITLFEHAYSSQFGTFLGNCMKERYDLNITRQTISLWSYINMPENVSQFLNPTYEQNDTVLWPSVAPQSIVLWESMYLRWIVNMSNFVHPSDVYPLLKMKETQLKNRAEKLQKQLLELALTS